MNKILKYPIDAGDIIAPVGKVLMVGYQGAGHLPTIWMEVPDNPEVFAHYHTLGTGWEVPNGLVHVGSAICGQYVWHVYREEEANG